MFFEPRARSMMLLGVASLLLIGSGVLLFVYARQAATRLTVQLHDVEERLHELESVYEVRDCRISTSEEGACELPEGKLFLSAPDADGEVRTLTLQDVEGKIAKLGQLPRDYSYVRKLDEESKPEGYVAEAMQAVVEVYAAKPRLVDAALERLPAAMQRLDINSPN